MGGGRFRPCEPCVRPCEPCVRPSQAPSHPPTRSEIDVPAKSHNRTRNDHASEVAEDYVEAIADVIADSGVCRSMDLVAHFDVTHATVNNTIGRLQRDGLVQTQPYQPITLTTSGRRLAAKAQARHETVRSFLKRIGVSDPTADIDSEGMEHHVSPETLKAMRQVLEHGLPPV